MNAVDVADRIVRSAYRREVIKRWRGIVVVGVLAVALALAVVSGPYLLGSWLVGRG